MLLGDLEERVRQRLAARYGDWSLAPADEVVRMTVEELGMGVTDAGVIYGPQQQPGQQNAHWRGSKRKR